MKLRHAFSSTDEFPGLKCEDPSLAKQADARDADINVIAGRFGLGPNDPVPVVMADWGDTDVSTLDFQTAMNMVVAGRESFDSQPAAIRAEFDHDPVKFAKFLANDKNRSRAEEMGLLAPKVGGGGGEPPPVAPAAPSGPSGGNPPGAAVPPAQSST